MKYTYYDYLDFVNNKKIKSETREIENNFTFEQFYDFHINAIKYAKRKKLNLNKVLIQEKFYLKYAENIYVYNEASSVKDLFNKAKTGVSNVINKTKEKIKETGESIYQQMASLSSLIGKYLTMIKLNPWEATKELLNLIYDWHMKQWKRIVWAANTLTNIKDEVVKCIESMILKIVAKLAGVATDDKAAVYKALQAKQTEIEKYFVSYPKERLIIGCLLAAVICYIWTESAFSGNPLFDFNVGLYLDLMSSTVPITQAITLTALIEIVVYFVVNKITSISSMLPNWFSTSANLTVVGGLLLTAFLIKAIDNSKNPVLMKFKKNICQFLSKPPSSIGSKITGDFADMAKTIGENSGVIKKGSNVAASCAV